MASAAKNILNLQTYLSNEALIELAILKTYIEDRVRIRIFARSTSLTPKISL